jgi:hypothetical protein
MERTDPMEPTERIEPAEPKDRIDRAEAMEHTEPHESGPAPVTSARYNRERAPAGGPPLLD